MKNFLIEFFRPLDNLIFNYFVRIGVIKPFLSAFIGKVLGSKAAGAVAGAALSARSASKARKASRAAEARSRADLERAFGEIKGPADLLREAYGTGIYSPEAMGTLLGRERELIPQFQELAEMRARGIRDIQAESKLRQLGMLGLLGGVSRELLEDPRLAKLAGLDVAEAERLTAEAAGPLGVEAARTAEQTALGLGQRMGRTLDASALARAALGREEAQRARRQEAAGARQRALQSATAAMVDPTAFLFTPSAEERIFAATPLGAQVTDPGQAITLGSARDVQRANVLIGQGALSSQAAAARAGIAGQQASTLGSLIGGMDFSGFGSRGASPMGTVGYGTVLATPAQQAGANLISGFQKLF